MSRKSKQTESIDPDPLKPNTECGVLIYAHGILYLSRPPIQVPDGKIIIKKGLASRGERGAAYVSEDAANELKKSLVDFGLPKCGMSITEYIELVRSHNKYIRRLISYNARVGILDDEYKKHATSNNLIYPFTPAASCNIQMDKESYIYRQYEASDPGDGIFILIRNEDGSISEYDITYPDQLWQLLARYVNKNNKKDAYKLWKLQMRPVPFNWKLPTMPIDIENTRMEWGTYGLFQLYKILPFITYKIMDISCATYYDDDKYHSLSNVKVGYGGTKTRRRRILNR